MTITDELGGALPGVLSFALIAGILVMLADTKLYPLAVAILGVALLYLTLEHSTWLLNFVHTTVGGAASHLGVPKQQGG